MQPWLYADAGTTPNQTEEENHDMHESQEKAQECARATITASRILESVIDELESPFIESAETLALCRSQLQDAAAELVTVCEYVREEVL